LATFESVSIPAPPVFCEIIAAKGDPTRVFGRHLSTPLPDADGVDLCVAQIHSANACHDFLRVNRVFEIDSEIAEQSALVTAEVEMIVLAPFAVCSPIASSCTGMCWSDKPGQPMGNQRGLFGCAQIADREGVRFPENRWRLALQHARARAGRLRRRGERAMKRQ
jgi:hypothetical protein